MKKTFLLSILSLIMAITIFAGSIYAWFLNSSTGTNAFFRDITRSSISSKIYLDNEFFVGEILELGHALPGDEFLFEIVVTNGSTLAIAINITFYDIVGEFSYFDANEVEQTANLMDIWELEYPLGTRNKLKDIVILGTTNVPIIVNDTIAPNGAQKTYTFKLRFGTEYDGDINIFQSRHMEITSLRIEEAD